MGGSQSCTLARDGDLIGLIQFEQTPGREYTHSEKIQISIVASSWGHLHILDWLRASGHILNEITYVSAVLSGREDVIDYLQYEKVEWSENVSFLMCAHDPKYMKEWIEKNGISPNILSYCDISFHQGELIVTDRMKKLFRELIDEGCPININECLEVCLNKGFRSCLLALKIEGMWNNVKVEDVENCFRVSDLYRYDLCLQSETRRVSDIWRYEMYLQWIPEEVMKDVNQLL
jgi:hypothetical protein